MLLSSTSTNNNSRFILKSLLEHSFNVIFELGLPPSTRKEIFQHLYPMISSFNSTKLNNEELLNYILELLIKKGILVVFTVGKDSVELYASHDYFPNYKAFINYDSVLDSQTILKTHQDIETPTKKTREPSLTIKKASQYKPSTPYLKISQPFKSPMMKKEILSTSTPINKLSRIKRSSSSTKSTPLKTIPRNIDPAIASNPLLMQLDSERRDAEAKICELEEAIRKKRLFRKHQEMNEAEKVDGLIRKWVSVSKEALIQLRDTIGITSLDSNTQNNNSNNTSFDNGFGWEQETNPMVLLMKAFKKKEEQKKDDEEFSRILTLKEISQKLGFDLTEIEEYDAENDCFI